MSDRFTRPTTPPEQPPERPRRVGAWRVVCTWRMVEDGQLVDYARTRHFTDDADAREHARTCRALAGWHPHDALEPQVDGPEFVRVGAVA